MAMASIANCDSLPGRVPAIDEHIAITSLTSIILSYYLISILLTYHHINESINILLIDFHIIIH